MWAKFGELVVPGVVVGIIMLLAQFGIELYREKRRLITEESWRAKKDAFSSAIRLVDQYLASLSWDGTNGHHAPSRETPADLNFEINSILAQLLLTVESPDIPKRFMSFFAKGSTITPRSRGEFIILLRKELFSSKTPLKPEEIPLAFGKNP